MSRTQPFVVDGAEVDRMLMELRVPTMRDMWHPFADRAPPSLRAPPHRSQAAPSKTLDNFDFGRLPGLSEPLVRVLARGGDWIDDGHNIVVLGPPGTGKSYLAAAIGLALVAAATEPRPTSVVVPA